MPKKTAQDPPKRRELARFTQDLPVPLTREELLEYGQQVARVNLALADHEGEAKALKKDLDSREAALERQRMDLCTRIRDKAEPRAVECVMEADYVARVVRTIRMDTCETIKTRALEQSEAQAEMSFPAEGRPEPPPPPKEQPPAPEEGGQ